jgi:glycosyltransferase involved in cell wall biosynthesis
MRPAFLINDLRSGGAERLVKDLAVEFLAIDDVDPVVVVADDLGGLKPELLDAGVEVVALDVPVTTTGIPRAVRRLSALLADGDVDLVHSHLPYSHVVGRLACGIRSVPHVATYHNVESHKTFPRRLAERVTSPLSARVVCVSEGVRRSYPSTDRAVVIYNGIDVAGFRETVASVDPAALPTAHDPDDTVYLNVARCVDQKRQRDLVEAVALLDADDVHLYVVGDGPLHDDLDALVADLGVGDRVTVTGFVEAVEPYYAAADVFVSASSNEGLPTTHLEAMAAGLPIVSTDISGVTELVEHGVNGYLCPVGSPSSLADRMADIRGPGAADFAATGLSLASERFSLETIAREHVDLYRELL